jgi:hypothetical protein
MGIQVVVGLSAVFVVCCADSDTRVCGQSFSATTNVAGCYPAQLFAARDSLALVPAQSDINRYWDRWTRATDREPILAGRHPQTYRNNPPSQIYLTTANMAVISEWESQQIVTGDPAFDSIIAQLDPLAINAFFTNPDGTADFNFVVQVDRVFNEEELERELMPTSSHLADPEVLPTDDGQWSWIEGTMGEPDVAQIDFTFGWGDCFVGCAGFRQLRAIVPATGDAIVYDLGGDPLPDYLQLSETTLPP